MIEFSHKNQYVKSNLQVIMLHCRYCPTLAADGTVFSVKVYCQYHNYETIKVIIIWIITY